MEEPPAGLPQGVPREDGLHLYDHDHQEDDNVVEGSVHITLTNTGNSSPEGVSLGCWVVKKKKKEKCGVGRPPRRGSAWRPRCHRPGVNLPPMHLLVRAEALLEAAMSEKKSWRCLLYFMILFLNFGNLIQ